MVDNGSVSNFTGSGALWTFVVTPTGTGVTTVTVTIGVGETCVSWS